MCSIRSLKYSIPTILAEITKIMGSMTRLVVVGSGFEAGFPKWGDFVPSIFFNTKLSKLFTEKYFG